MDEKTRKNPERKSLKAWPATHKRIRIMQRSMADPDTFKEPSQEVIVEMAIGALERERLTQSNLIPANSHDNSLTMGTASIIIAVRPEERVPVENLVGILRHADASVANEIRHELDLLSGKIGAELHGDQVGTGSEAIPGHPGGDPGKHGMVAGIVRNRARQTKPNKS